MKKASEVLRLPGRNVNGLYWDGERCKLTVRHLITSELPPVAGFGSSFNCTLPWANTISDY